MAWQMPNMGQWNPGMAMTPDMNMGSYTPEQWTAMQQQNWQQWQQWQQQYTQWQTQYGEKYAQHVQVAPIGGMPPLPGTAAPPAPPPPDQPPPPPPHENDQPLFGNNGQSITNQPPPPRNSSNYSSTMPATGNNQWSYGTDATIPAPQPAANIDALKKLAEEEKLFDIQFQKWEEEIEKWRKENVNHPDKQAYKEYEQKFEACRAQLLERRQQMNTKKARLLNASQAPNTSVSGNSTPAVPPLMQSTPQSNYNQNTQSQNYKNNSYKQEYNASQPSANRGNNKNTDPQDRFESYPNKEDIPPVVSYTAAPSDPSSFLATSSSKKSIPGLDLVSDNSLGNKQLDVIDITDDQDMQQPQAPDYSKISKGINNILGDEKIMNILSMVQGQNIPQGANTTPNLPLNTPHGASHQNIPPNQGNRNQPNNFGQNDQYGNKQNMSFHRQGSNFPQQSQGINPQYSEDMYDDGQDMQYYDRNAPYDGPNSMTSGAPDMRRGGPNIRPGGPGMRPGGNFGMRQGGPGGSNMRPGGPGGPNMRPAGPGGPNMRPGGPDMRQGGPDMRQGGPDMRQGGPGMQQGGPGMQQGGPGMQQGGPGMQQGGPGMRQGGPDIHQGGPGGRQGGPDMRQGGPDMRQGGPGMRQGGLDMRQGGPGVRQGGPDMRQGGPDTRQGGSDMRQGGSGMRQGGPDMKQGGPNMHQGGPNMHQGGPNMHQGMPDMYQGGSNMRPGGTVQDPHNNMQPSHNNMQPSHNNMQAPNNNMQAPNNNAEIPPLMGRNNAPQGRPPLLDLPPQQNMGNNMGDYYGGPEGPRHDNPVVVQPPRPKWVEDPLFTPSIVVEYDHKPLRLKARDFIEPVHTFDYNHKSKDEELNKKKDFEKEVEELFTRKPRREREDEVDRYGRDMPHRDYERRMPREDVRDVREMRDDYRDMRDDFRLRERPREDLEWRPREDFERRPRDDFERRPREDFERRPRDDFERRPKEDFERRPREDFERRLREDIERRRVDDRYDDRRRDDRDRYHRRDDLREREKERDAHRDLSRERDRNRDMKRDDNRISRRDDSKTRSGSKDIETRKRGLSKDTDISNVSSKKSKEDKENSSDEKKHVVMIDDLLEPPGRDMRPEKLVIILRGPPGSGKSYLAKLIRDKEAEHGGTARIMSIDDYFMQEGETEEKDPNTGKTVKKPFLKFEYDEASEETYLNSLKRAFKRSLTDGYFSFLIYDAVNDQLKHYADIWNFARQNGFQAYICTMEIDPQECFKRNIHNRKLEDIEVICARFFPTPSHHIQLDATTLLQSAAITEVQMEDVEDDDDDVIMEDVQEAEVDSVFTSKWEKMDDATKLARLDGTSKPLRSSHLSMEDYLQLDDWIPNTAKPGKKTVRWADIEERREQDKMRAIGFVVGQTDWNRMTDPTMGSSALTKTKYIERVRRN